ncbi:hypothetical protein [Bradyrhizobium sp. CER78]|uniref:hypothetical protein n=1 Tax=Bradyrhizobium sp. CER78 TaxID=3039162 RepID=UPI00244C13F8|nr:hypothetical protein [Bradyrhizobium sp. CER78]MDH2384820.1 hypothetical protein [Bradyrhizobium sp. CER78]
MIKIPDQPDPPSNVFALATPYHLLHKLYWEIEQLRSSLASKRSLAETHAPAYHAFNCAVTCWYLTDWVWESAEDYQRELMCSTYETKLKTVEDFQAAMRTRHRSLYVCWQIANGSKHFRLRKTDPQIKTDQVWEYRPARAGRTRAGQKAGSYVYRLSLTDGDQRREALEIFEDAVNVWERELGAWFFIEGRYVGPD